MTEPSSNRPDASFRAVVAEAARRGHELIGQSIEHARQALPHRMSMASNGQDRESQAEAMRLLLQHQADLRTQYPQALLAEFAQAIAGSPGQPSKEPAGALSFDALELMGDDQVQESVELARAQQATGQAVESDLGGLNALVCAAQGLKSVQADRNPLRPEIYVRALRSVIADTGVSAAVRLRWMQYLGEALGPLLAADYKALIAMLRSQGVQAAGFSVTMSADTGAAQRGATGMHGAATGAAPGGMAVGMAGAGGPLTAGGPGGAAAAPTQARMQTLLTVRQLRRLLSGEFDAGSESFDAQFTREFESSAREFPSAEFSPTVPAAFEVLQEMKQVDQVIQRLSERQAAPPTVAAPGSVAALREQLRRKAGTGQALGLEVVSLMVDNIANDIRLLPEVQQAVRELEPALLRLALIDPRFFSDKRHPARRLLEELTQQSLAWQDPASAGFQAFIEPVRQAVEVLVTTAIEGPAPFAFALQTLEELWAEQHKRERRKRDKAVRTLMVAEQRNLLADKIARDLRQRAETAGAPRGIVYFIAGPWAQVIAQARLGNTSGGSDPGGYEDAVTDLLWSVMPETASANPSRLARLIPGLLEKLRDGLESIGFSRAKSTRFFEELMVLHARAGQPPGTMAPAGSPRERLEAQFRDADAVGGGLWLAPSEAQQSGFLDTQSPSALPKPIFAQTQQAFGDTVAHEDEPPAPAEAAPGALAVLDLQPGAWVELQADGRWVRCQLTWASPHGTLFMFTQADGTNHSMTRQSLVRLVSGGQLRVLAAHAVVDGALDAVAQAALRNSVDVTL